MKQHKKSPIYLKSDTSASFSSSDRTRGLVPGLVDMSPCRCAVAYRPQALEDAHTRCKDVDTELALEIETTNRNGRSETKRCPVCSTFQSAGRKTASDASDRENQSQTLQAIIGQILPQVDGRVRRPLPAQLGGRRVPRSPHRAAARRL